MNVKREGEAARCAAPPPLKEFTEWFTSSGTRKLDAILQGQEDARRRMDDLIKAINSKENLDESVLALMNSISEQILDVGGHDDLAVALADEVKEKVALMEIQLAEARISREVEDGHREDHGQHTVRTERRMPD